MATIKNHSDETVRDNLLESMIMTGAEKIPFINHIQSVLPPIQQELESEFVDEGWLSKKKFDRIMDATLDKLLS